MARINSYPTERPVQDDDAWIGSTYPGGKTRQFRADDVAKYLNIKGKISISGQMVFRFSVGATQPGEFTGPTDGDSLNSFTTLSISGADLSGQQTENFVQYLVGSNILISEQNNIDEFAHYTIDSYTSTGNNVYDLVLTNIAGNGSVKVEKNYDFAAFTISSGTGDKTFNFTQGSPSATWVIQHNLGKFPSATVVDTGDTSVLGGQIEYIDNNNLTITFGAAFAGKAFLN